jgi:hypothetical protein
MRFSRLGPQPYKLFDLIDPNGLAHAMIVTWAMLSTPLQTNHIRVWYIVFTPIDQHCATHHVAMHSRRLIIKQEAGSRVGPGFLSGET